MIFCADDSTSCAYEHFIVFEADTFAMARVICAEEGWCLRGALRMAVTEPAFTDGHEETILAILPDDFSEQVH